MKCCSLKSLQATWYIYMPSRAHGCYNQIYNMNANCRGRLWYSVSVSYVSSPEELKVVIDIGILNGTCKAI
jgi:hypothetical protein